MQSAVHVADREKQFDVAISFCARDERLAAELAALLAPLNVFVYSKKQEEIAGTDGTESFREVFRTESRIVVVLHRETWGNTRWTRVEELAIQDYMLESRFQPLVFVQLDKSAPPKWLPETLIRFDLETYSVDQLIGAIKAVAARHGAVLKSQTTVQKARLLAEQEAYERETRDLLQRGPELFYETSSALFAALSDRATTIQADTGWNVRFGPVGPHDFMLFISPASFQLLPENLYANTAADAFYRVRLFEGRFATAEETSQRRYVSSVPTPKGEHQLMLARTKALDWCWDYQGIKRSAADTADALITTLLELRGRLRIQRA
jgi:hypothetical protein